jgi:hypothetical protein
MRRALLAFVLVLSVVTAGCNSFFDGVGPTPAPETTHLSGELAPGLSAEGVTDRGELTEAHARILLEKSFTVRSRLVERAADGSVLGRRKSATRVESNHSHYSIYSASNGSMVDGFYRSPGNGSAAGEREAEFAVWSNGSLSLVATTVDGRTNYGRRRGGSGFLVDGVESATNHDRLYVLFTAMNVTRVERIETAESGTPTYKVVANDLSNPVAIASNDGFDSVENASLVAVVDT